MIRGIFFDLGGTLLSYKNVNKTTLPILEEAIMRSGKKLNKDKIKAAYRESSSIIAAQYATKKYYLHKHFFNDVFLRFLKTLGIDGNTELLSWYANFHREEMIDCLILKADCIETLNHLRSKGIYISIVSNIDNDMLNPLLKKENLGSLTDHTISSETARSCKPDRRIFEIALEKSTLSPKSIIFVGDSPEHDIGGAKPLGFKTALITDGGLGPPLQTGKQVPRADYTIDSLSELTALIK
ncbi:MAG: HAD family hydrolase [Pseudomonadota bacterium]|nr:HAD family hydrolase [Pseudomonadota bacterium]